MLDKLFKDDNNSENQQSTLFLDCKQHFCLKSEISLQKVIEYFKIKSLLQIDWTYDPFETIDRNKVYPDLCLFAGIHIFPGSTLTSMPLRASCC